MKTSCSCTKNPPGSFQDLIRAILGAEALSKPMDEQKRSLQDYLSAWAVSFHEISAMERDGEFTWLVVWNMFFFLHSVGYNNPNWRTHIFQRGRYTTNQLHMFLFVFFNEFRRLDGILVDLRHHCLWFNQRKRGIDQKLLWFIMI